MVSGRFSNWLVLCWTITTPSPHDVLGPGECATIQSTTQKHHAGLVSVHICTGGVSSRAWAVKVYFWMYSLHSERVAVGARQLWRQRVIVARQPDRPKMAELTGTGEQAKRTLALASLVVIFPSVPRWHTLWWAFTRLRSLQLLLMDFYKKEKKSAEESTKKQREAEGSEEENPSLSAFLLKVQLHKRQPPSSPCNHIVFHKEIIGRNWRQRERGKGRWVGEKSEKR